MKYRFTIASYLLFFFVLFSFQAPLHSQGVTTSAINGIILDANNNPLIAATIKAVHNPSNTVFGTTSRTTGNYNINNMRVGGPYTITVSFVGYQPIVKENVYLELGKNVTFNFTLSTNTVQTQEVNIFGTKNNIINSDRTGATSNVNTQIIEDFPTISRSFQDFYKFSPQFSGSPLSGSSASGRNNRYNNIQIDGTVYNDLFGLSASGTPGGQTGTNPISLDAIEEFQILIAPYDVRMGGFTGGGVNAITKSGTNDYKGSVFFFGRNESFVGKSPDVKRTPYKDFSEYQTGFRFGGPIMKDKLFFFVSGEMTEKKEPIENISLTQIAGKNVDSLATSMRNILVNKYGYNPGDYSAFNLERPSLKLFARIDWNINENHRLTLRNNYVDASDDNLPRNISTFLFSDRNYQLKSVTNSTVLQLNSTFSNFASNDLTVGLTTIRDKREVEGNPFPSIRVNPFSGLALRAGTEEFSIANSLDQDIIELTDNFSMFFGQHVVTVGTHNEFFTFKNLYIQNMYGYYEFNSLADLDAGKVARYQYSYSLTGNPKQAAKFSALQFGFYAQDEWTVNTQLKMNLGLRVDIPTFPDKPAYNPKAETVYGLRTDEVPTGKLLFSPRFGFNYNPLEDQSLQIRGGAGLFTGKIPYVWISNQYSNTGVEFGRVDVRNLAAGSFVRDPFNQPIIGSIPTSEINITDKDFKMPQTMRLNAAVDKTLPFGFTGTIEFVYSKTVNDIFYQDLNIGAQQTTLYDGRPFYGTITSSGAVSPVKTSSSFTNAILMKNTSDGSSYQLSAQLQNQVSDMVYVNMGYTYGNAKDRTSLTSSRAISNFQYNPVPGDPNAPPLTTSNFQTEHRLFAAVTYSVNFYKHFKSTFTLFYNGQTGRPFSYTYNGDVNGDGNTSNDLIYVPKDASEITLTTNNWDAFNKYIENDEYLSDSRGKIVERNGGREPWLDQLDFRFVQEIANPWVAGHKLEISVDILNVLNLLNSDWGYIETVVNQNDNLLKLEKFVGGKPTFSFTNKENPFQKENLLSRWQMQLGIRYTF